MTGRRPPWLPSRRAAGLVFAAGALAGAAGCMGTAQAHRIARAEATLEVVQRLSAAMDAYARDQGTAAAGTAEEIAATLSAAKAPDRAPYLELPASLHLRGGGPFDAWDRVIVVKTPGTHGGHAAEVYSMGEDGRDEGGGGDDVSAWGGYDKARYAARPNPVDLAAAGGWGGAVLATFLAGLAVRLRRRRSGRAAPRSSPGEAWT